jgi:DNA-binding IclR family transcriptional regulator
MRIQVVAKAAAVLDLLGTDDCLSFTEIWQGTGLNKTTVAHLLGTLHEVGYVEKLLDGRYRLGPGILQLAQHRLRHAIMTEVAEAQALALARETGATVTIAAFEAGERHKLAKATADLGPVLDPASDRKVNLYDTATGRLLLAFADDKEREQAFARQGMPGERWPEVKERRDLVSKLNALRRSGVAVKVGSDGQAESVAVPVFGPDGRAWAALGISVPAGAARSADHDVLVRRLQAAADQFTEVLRQRLGEGRPSRPAEA